MGSIFADLCDMILTENAGTIRKWQHNKGVLYMRKVSIALDIISVALSIATIVIIVRDWKQSADTSEKTN
jgi:hypothetical protein